jgi:TolB-like protein/DNA-binding winged helix-turn-helix (wHTH) protein/tetratricopeptide (TPR) repeat protein
METDYRLGDWLVQPRRDCIQRGDEVVHLKPKVMAVLGCLAEAGGEVVSRDDLFDRVWRGAIVSDATLTQCVVELRQAFGDSAKNPEFIETIPKIGFRLIPPVLDPEADGSSRDAAPEPSAEIRPDSARAGSMRRWLPAAGVVLLLGLLAWYAVSLREGPERPAGAGITSLAVLPFSDLSADQDQGWIADSLAVQLLNRLSELEGLAVAGKTPSFTFKGKNPDLQAVADALHVDFVLEGSVLREADQLHITTQLVDVASGDIWLAETFDRPMEDFLAIQDEITESVVTALSITLNVGWLGTEPGGPSSVEAFRSVQRAMEAWVEDSGISWLEAIQLAEHAVELDPDYVYAWMLCAQLYGMAEAKIGDVVRRDWQALRSNALEEAGRRAPDMQQLLGMILNFHTEAGRFSEAQNVLTMAGPLDAIMNPELLFHVGIFMTHTGRARDAVVALERAEFLDDRWAHFKRMLAYAYLINGRAEEALEMYDRAWAEDDLLRAIGSTEGLNAALVAGDQPTIEKWLSRSLEFSERDELRFLTAMQKYLGDSLAALAWLHETYERNETDVHDGIIAIWAAYYGDQKLALDATLRTPNTWWPWFPLFSEVRKQPQFKTMVRELGLVDFWREYTWGDFCRPSGTHDFECN